MSAKRLFLKADPRFFRGGCSSAGHPRHCLRGSARSRRSHRSRVLLDSKSPKERRRNPEIKAKIEARIRNVPEQNRERAFINAAKTEALNQTVKPPRIHP